MRGTENKVHALNGVSFSAKSQQKAMKVCMLTLLLMGSLNGVEFEESDDLSVQLDSDGRPEASLPSNMAETTIQYSSSSSSIKSII
jgi:hypothetical protein